MNRSGVGPTSSEVVAANVRAELGRRQVAASRLAEGMSLGRVSLSRRLNGHAHWTIDEVASAASYLAVPIEALLTPHDARKVGA